MIKLEVFHYKLSDDFIMRGSNTKLESGETRLHDLTLFNLKNGKATSLIVGTMASRDVADGLNFDKILIDEDVLE